MTKNFQIFLIKRILLINIIIERLHHVIVLEINTSKELLLKFVGKKTGIRLLSRTINFVNKTVKTVAKIIIVKNSTRNDV